jgi:hypothetical protein
VLWAVSQYPSDLPSAQGRPLRTKIHRQRTFWQKSLALPLLSC